MYGWTQFLKKKKAISLGSRADTKQTECLFGILILILTQATANPSHPKCSGASITCYGVLLLEAELVTRGECARSATCCNYNSTACTHRHRELGLLITSFVRAYFSLQECSYSTRINNNFGSLHIHQHFPRQAILSLSALWAVQSLLMEICSHAGFGCSAFGRR